VVGGLTNQKRGLGECGGIQSPRSFFEEVYQRLL